jgi:hypothetical protein
MLERESRHPPVGHRCCAETSSKCRSDAQITRTDAALTTARVMSEPPPLVVLGDSSDEELFERS